MFAQKLNFDYDASELKCEESRAIKRLKSKKRTHDGI